MRVMVLGAAGAVTAPLVASLVAAKDMGEDVSLFVQAPDGRTSTEALKKFGITVTYNPEGTNRKPPRFDTVHVPSTAYEVIDPTAEADPSKKKPEPMDFIVLGVKGTEIDFKDIADYIGPNTRIVTLQNGLPPWVAALPEFQKANITYIEAVDPEGKQIEKYGDITIGGLTATAAAPLTYAKMLELDPNRETYKDLFARLDAERAAYLDDEVALKKFDEKNIPGTSVVRGDYPYVFGNPHGDVTPEMDAFTAILHKGGLNLGPYKEGKSFAKNRAELGNQVFLKLLGNAVFNFIASLEDVSLKQIYEDKKLHKQAIAMMKEVQKVAIKLGIEGAEDFNLEKRLKDAGTMTHKTSTHADIWGGKKAEIDGLLRALIDVADQIEVPVPRLYSMYNRIVDLAHEKGSPYTKRPMHPQSVTVAQVRKLQAANSNLKANLLLEPRFAA